jgi:lysine-N-methylase
MIPVDQAANDKFRILPPSPLRTLIDANILRTPRSDGSSKPATFATFQMTASKACPLLSEDSLCRIQTEFGEAFLPHACATYPRIISSIGDIEEKALALSCPEAARLVLLNPDLFNPSNPAITEPLCSQPQEGDTAEGTGSLQPWFRFIRESVLGLVLNRTFPLWQRLFLLGVFCRRLDSIVEGQLKCSIPAFLRDFEVAVASGILPNAMETLPADLSQQLDVVLRLAGMLLHSSNVHARFVECIQAFTAGIGNGPCATFESLTANYALAHDRGYKPFFNRQPHILENYLINTILRCQFPFGREGMRTGASPSMTREHALLTAQFVLMKGFLIGVAGFHGETFCTDHVVHTVQSVSKHFEHHTEFLNQAHALLAESQMNGERGFAILLRNDRPVSKPGETVSNLLS